MKRHVMEEKGLEYEIQIGQETANLEAQNKASVKDSCFVLTGFLLIRV